MDFGKAIMMVTTLTGTTIVAFFVLAHASRCFMTVVQDTAAGCDEATWPDEPWKDWFRSSAHFVGLLGIWLAPAGILARLLRFDLLPDDGPLRFLVIVGPALWLLFPIGLLSALSSTSQWAPVRLTLLRQLLRILPSLLLFYLLTALLGGVGVVPWFFALFRKVAYGLPLAAALGAAALLIYARLLGRLGWLVARLKPLPVKKTARPARKGPARRNMKSIRKAVRTRDPWAAPKGELTLPGSKPALPVEGYALGKEETKRKKQRNQPAAEEAEPKPLPVEGYDFSNEPIPDDRTLAQEAARLGQTTSDLEKHLFEPSNPPTIPPYPLFSGVFTFPWYSSTMKQWITMSLGCGAVGFGVKALIDLLK